jgi:uncharacterized protein YdeI (YjbR/CyaY-like superfamily)
VVLGGRCWWPSVGIPTGPAVAPMGGRSWVTLNADNRAVAGVTAGDEVDVQIVADIAPREVDVPGDLAEALAGDPTAATFSNELAYIHRKEWVRWIEDAKRAETRATRLAKTIASLHTGERVR